MTIKSVEILDQIKPQDRDLLQNRELIRRFGRDEDCVELHVYDLNGNLIDTVYNFEDYEIPSVDDPDGYFSEIVFNPDKVLRDLGYNTGEYDLRVNFHRKKVLNTFENIFYVNTISPSRTELRVKIKDIDNLSSLILATNNFIGDLGDPSEGFSYFKDFALNFGNDIVLTGVNFIAEEGQNNSFLIKLYEPLPNSFEEKAQFRVIEEITNPIKYRIDLGTPEITISSTELRGPNLRIDTRLNSSVPTTYRNYNDILSYTSSGSLSNVLNSLSSSIPVSVEYDNPNTDSGYIYDKFIHFSSAEERIRNFKYKLDLIELYTSKSAYMDTLNPSYVTTLKQENENLKNKIIQDFDGYERYLYFESGTYAWPKSTNSKPYSLYSTSASEATSWFDSQVENAEDYDGLNPYILRNTLPQYIIDNDQNEQFILFTDMIGQYFDNIWLYIENITDKNIAHNSLKEGISKDLVFNALKERGIPAFDQFENANLFEYLIGSDNGSDIFKYQAPSGQTMVSSSNESVPKGDITKEVWKRLYHNAPYLLKTKGTERGIKALLACYGIPEGILHVKEYGGPNADKSGFRTFRYPKTILGLRIEDSTDTTEFLSFDFNSTSEMVEFTIIPDKTTGGYGNVILSSTDSDSSRYIAIQTSSIYEESGKFVFWNGSSISDLSSEFPAFCGKPITIFLKEPSPNTIDLTAGMYLDSEYFEIDATDADFVENHPYTIGRGGNTENGHPSDFLVHNFKVYNSGLNEDTREIHTKDPNIIAGNTTSSYFDDDLTFYSPLGATISKESIAASYNFIDYSNDGTNTRLTAGKAIEYEDMVYDHHIVTPDTVGSSMASEKVRYDQGTIDDNILSPTVRAEESALDRQPQDFSTLGVFFSPTFELNEDIIHTLGGFRLDDYIGDPRHLNSGSYPDLKDIRDVYFEKIEHRYNFWDYLKTIQYFDHTIFKLIEEFVPAKANLKTGYVIEPHYLERDKITYANTDFSNISVPVFDIPDVAPGLSSEYSLHECVIDVEDVLDGSEGVYENNWVWGPISSKYFRVAVSPNDGFGTPIINPNPPSSGDEDDSIPFDPNSYFD
jgi:hypothetical protein